MSILVLQRMIENAMDRLNSVDVPEQKGHRIGLANVDSRIRSLYKRGRELFVLHSEKYVKTGLYDKAELTLNNALSELLEAHKGRAGDHAAGTHCKNI